MLTGSINPMAITVTDPAAALALLGPLLERELWPFEEG